MKVILFLFDNKKLKKYRIFKTDPKYYWTVSRYNFPSTSKIFLKYRRTSIVELPIYRTIFCPYALTEYTL